MAKPLTIGRIETFLVPPRWLFVRVETEDGAVGWGEPSLNGGYQGAYGYPTGVRESWWRSFACEVLSTS